MTDKKLTDGEIIKALKILEKDTNCGDCAVKKQCKGDCVFTKSLDLINRLQEENERLRNAYKQCAFERDAYIEIENTAIAEAKAEAYKEFAERLKDMSEHFWEEKENFVSEEQIDNLLKELAG